MLFFTKLSSKISSKDLSIIIVVVFILMLTSGKILFLIKVKNS